MKPPKTDKLSHKYNKPSAVWSNSAEPHDQPEDFSRFVRKAKNVMLFGQKLKKRLAYRQSLANHNLREYELDYL
jgi:hypothetical protein